MYKLTCLICGQAALDLGLAVASQSDLAVLPCLYKRGPQCLTNQKVTGIVGGQGPEGGKPCPWGRLVSAGQVK
jgi:hypothetical protein